MWRCLGRQEWQRFQEALNEGAVRFLQLSDEEWETSSRESAPDGTVLEHRVVSTHVFCVYLMMLEIIEHVMVRGRKMAGGCNDLQIARRGRENCAT